MSDDMIISKAFVVAQGAEIATLRADLAKAREEVERLKDCHAGPGTTEPACGACASCLTRLLDEEHKAWSVEYQSGAIWQQRALAAERARDEAVAEVARLKEALESFAEQGCYYGDNCPDNAGTRHGRCGPCHARRALGRTDGEG